MALPQRVEIKKSRAGSNGAVFIDLCILPLTSSHSAVSGRLKFTSGEALELDLGECMLHVSTRDGSDGSLRSSNGQELGLSLMELIKQYLMPDLHNVLTEEQRRSIRAQLSILIGKHLETSALPNDKPGTHWQLDKLITVPLDAKEYTKYELVTRQDKKTLLYCVRWGLVPTNYDLFDGLHGENGLGGGYLDVTAEALSLRSIPHGFGDPPFLLAYDAALALLASVRTTIAPQKLIVEGTADISVPLKGLLK